MAIDGAYRFAVIGGEREVEEVSACTDDKNGAPGCATFYRGFVYCICICDEMKLMQTAAWLRE